MAVGGLATFSEAWSRGQETPATPIDISKEISELRQAKLDATATSLSQEIEFKASPHRVYEALLSSKQFAAFTKMAAKIEPKAGGAFSMFGGMIVGRTIELVTDKRIVQAWRPATWHAGDYSIVRFDLKPHGAGTTLELLHKGFPDGDHDSLDSGWHERYWEPLNKYLT
jgi:activator of HSP90 ATPase